MIFSRTSKCFFTLFTYQLSPQRLLLNLPEPGIYPILVHQLFASDTRVAHADVLVQRVVEEEAVLKDEGDDVRQPLVGDALDVDAADEYQKKRELISS